MMRQNTTSPASLAEWLAYLETLHFKDIDLTLERVQEVFNRLDITYHSTVITVAGTNGKGTTSAALEEMARYQNKTVGVFSSPHLVDYKERVRINGEMLSEEAHCKAFQRVEEARANTALTAFEFGTLAALCLLDEYQTDVVILEVGLGGRLDAVNVVDPDLSVITSIGLDHQEYLGETREEIAVEKAGILRKCGKAVIGEMDPPQSLIDEVNRVQANALWQNKDFKFIENHDGSWEWQSRDNTFKGLNGGSIPVQNLSTAFACAELLGWELDEAMAVHVSQKAALPGRFQIIQTEPLVVLDVAHNPDATQYLKQKLFKLNAENLHLVVGMLADKDLANSLEPFKGIKAQWYVSSLPTPRTAETAELLLALGNDEKVKAFKNIKAALESAQSSASKQDAILAFGSFYTVADVLFAYS